LRASNLLPKTAKFALHQLIGPQSATMVALHAPACARPLVAREVAIRESHVGTGETRRYVVLLSGRSLLRILLLDQGDIGTFASQHRTGKRGLFVLVNSSLSLIGAGVALSCRVRRLGAWQDGQGRLRGLSGRSARRALLLPGRAKSMPSPFSRRHSASSHLASPLALVVLVRDDLNRLFRLREEPSPRTSRRKNCVSTRPP